MANPQDSAYSDMTLSLGVQYASSDEDREMIGRLQRRVISVSAEQDRFRIWCDRADQLYFAEEFTRGGADLWATDPSAEQPGRSHVSINTPAVYVDVPAALQAVEPIENMLATEDKDTAREAAAHLERIYTAWKADNDYELGWHRACTITALYGRTASKVYIDEDEDPKQPVVDVIAQPRNLYLGYKSNDWEEVEWAAYVERVEPNALREEYGVDILETKAGGVTIPFVQIDASAYSQPSRLWLNFGPARIEVWDYWYREPKGKVRPGKPTKMSTWNVVIAGNAIVSGPTEYPNYEGEIPFNPLFNTFIPGVPTGRPELYDIEPLIREKYTAVTAGAQMIANGVAGDYWQLVGTETVAGRVPTGLKPIRNGVISPGPGSRLESITPFIAQFQLEQYLGRLDREMGVVSGLNDLLLGLAPSQVLSSSKAINALISNYESRLSMRRKLKYAWRKRNWDMALKLWSYTNPVIAKLIKAGGGRLDIQDPSLSPRDEMETAQRAIALMGAKIWSQRRAMDATGVDDPEIEQELIREERTDATMFPESVQVMAQLLQALQALGLQAPKAAQDMAGAQLGQGQNDLRTALGAASAPGIPGGQAGGEQAPPNPDMLVPGATPPEPTPGQPFAAPPPTTGAAGNPAQAGPLGMAQTTIAKGKPTSIIRTRQNLGQR